LAGFVVGGARVNSGRHRRTAHHRRARSCRATQVHRLLRDLSKLLPPTALPGPTARVGIRNEDHIGASLSYSGRRGPFLFRVSRHRFTGCLQDFLIAEPQHANRNRFVRVIVDLDSSGISIVFGLYILCGRESIEVSVGSASPPNRINEGRYRDEQASYGCKDGRIHCPRPRKESTSQSDSNCQRVRDIEPKSSSLDVAVGEDDEYSVYNPDACVRLHAYVALAPYALRYRKLIAEAADRSRLAQRRWNSEPTAPARGKLLLCIQEVLVEAMRIYVAPKRFSFILPCDRGVVDAVKSQAPFLIRRFIIKDGPALEHLLLGRSYRSKRDGLKIRQRVAHPGCKNVLPSNRSPPLAQILECIQGSLDTWVILPDWHRSHFPRIHTAQSSGQGGYHRAGPLYHHRYICPQGKKAEERTMHVKREKGDILITFDGAWEIQAVALACDAAATAARSQRGRRQDYFELAERATAAEIGGREPRQLVVADKDAELAIDALNWWTKTDPPPATYGRSYLDVRELARDLLATAGTSL
jgi:hypothetical protein